MDEVDPFDDALQQVVELVGGSDDHPAVKQEPPDTAPVVAPAPQPVPVSNKIRFCLLCAAWGAHKTKRCVKMAHITCVRCGAQGHVAKMCKDPAEAKEVKEPIIKQEEDEDDDDDLEMLRQAALMSRNNKRTAPTEKPVIEPKKSKMEVKRSFNKRCHPEHGCVSKWEKGIVNMCGRCPVLTLISEEAVAVDNMEGDEQTTVVLRARCLGPDGLPPDLPLGALKVFPVLDLVRDKTVIVATALTHAFHGNAVLLAVTLPPGAQLTVKRAQEVGRWQKMRKNVYRRRDFEQKAELRCDESGVTIKKGEETTVRCFLDDPNFSLGTPFVPVLKHPKLRLLRMSFTRKRRGALCADLLLTSEEPEGVVLKEEELLGVASHPSRWHSDPRVRKVLGGRKEITMLDEEASDMTASSSSSSDDSSESSDSDSSCASEDDHSTIAASGEENERCDPIMEDGDSFKDYFDEMMTAESLRVTVNNEVSSSSSKSNVSAIAYNNDASYRHVAAVFTCTEADGCGQDDLKRRCRDCELLPLLCDEEIELGNDVDKVLHRVIRAKGPELEGRPMRCVRVIGLSPNNNNKSFYMNKPKLVTALTHPYAGNCVMVTLELLPGTRLSLSRKTRLGHLQRVSPSAFPMAKCLWAGKVYTEEEVLLAPGQAMDVRVLTTSKISAFVPVIPKTDYNVAVANIPHTERCGGGTGAAQLKAVKLQLTNRGDKELKLLKGAKFGEVFHPVKWFNSSSRLDDYIRELQVGARGWDLWPLNPCRGCPKYHLTMMQELTAHGKDHDEYVAVAALCFNRKEDSADTSIQGKVVTVEPLRQRTIRKQVVKLEVVRAETLTFDANLVVMVKIPSGMKLTVKKRTCIGYWHAECKHGKATEAGLKALRVPLKCDKSVTVTSKDWSEFQCDIMVKDGLELMPLLPALVIEGMVFKKLPWVNEQGRMSLMIRMKDENDAGYELEKGDLIGVASHPGKFNSKGKLLEFLSGNMSDLLYPPEIVHKKPFQRMDFDRCLGTCPRHDLILLEEVKMDNTTPYSKVIVVAAALVRNNKRAAAVVVVPDDEESDTVSGNVVVLPLHSPTDFAPRRQRKQTERLIPAETKPFSTADGRVLVSMELPAGTDCHLQPGTAIGFWHPSCRKRKHVPLDLTAWSRAMTCQQRVALEPGDPPETVTFKLDEDFLPLALLQKQVVIPVFDHLAEEIVFTKLPVLEGDRIKLKLRTTSRLVTIHLVTGDRMGTVHHPSAFAGLDLADELTKSMHSVPRSVTIPRDAVDIIPMEEEEDEPAAAAVKRLIDVPIGELYDVMSVRSLGRVQGKRAFLARIPGLPAGVPSITLPLLKASRVLPVFQLGQDSYTTLLSDSARTGIIARATPDITEIEQCRSYVYCMKNPSNANISMHSWTSMDVESTAHDEVCVQEGHLLRIAPARHEMILDRAELLARRGFTVGVRLRKGDGGEVCLNEGDAVLKTECQRCLLGVERLLGMKNKKNGRNRGRK